MDHQHLAPITPPTNYQASNSHLKASSGKKFGLVSLALAFVFPPLAIIASIMAIQQSRKVNQQNILAVIALVCSSFITFCGFIAGGFFIYISLLSNHPTSLITNNALTSGAAANDVETMNDIGLLQAQLEQYYVDNNSYPTSVGVHTFASLKPDALYASNGKMLDSMTVASKENAVQLPDPTSTDGYQYIAYRCSAQGCASYILRGFIENPNIYAVNPYIKESLN